MNVMFCISTYCTDAAIECRRACQIKLSKGNIRRKGTVLDMNVSGVAQRAKDLGVRSVPAVAIDGKIADCCSGRGPDIAVLQAEGVGQPLP